MVPVALPQSITQAEEEESLKKRFGVEALPEVGHVHDNVRMTQSAGLEGPDRKKGKMALIALLLLLAGGGVLLFFAHQNGMLDKLLQGQ